MKGDSPANSLSLSLSLSLSSSWLSDPILFPVLYPYPSLFYLSPSPLPLLFFPSLTYSESQYHPPEAQGSYHVIGGGCGLHGGETERLQVA